MLTSLSLLESELNNFVRQHKGSIIERYEIKHEKTGYDESSLLTSADFSLILMESFDVLPTDTTFPASLNRHDASFEDKTHLRVVKELAKSQHWAIKQEGFKVIFIISGICVT